MLYCFFICRF